MVALSSDTADDPHSPVAGFVHAHVGWLFTDMQAFGEGWHNNHHAFPRSAFHGLRWWQVDFSAYIIRGLERLGVAQQVWRIPLERLQTRSRITGPSSKHRSVADKARKDNSVRSTGTILVVDQERTIADLVVEILTDEGYIAYTAPDSADILATIAQHRPALILLDMRSPGLLGAELITQVRAAGLAAVPIVVMTTAPCDAAPLLVPESIECLAKPFDLDDLLACVARYVQPLQAADQSLALQSNR